MQKIKGTATRGLLAFVFFVGTAIGASPALAGATAPSDRLVKDAADTLTSQAAVTLPPPPTNFKTLTLPKGKKGVKNVPDATSIVTAKGNTAFSTLATCTGGCYYYNTGSQSWSSGTLPTGVFANYSVGTSGSPALATSDNHTLAEAAAIKTVGGKRQIVEIGWNIDRTVNGDTNPHLFGFWWKNGVGQCYNGCGFVPVSGAAYSLGQTLTGGASLQLGIQYTQGNWWLWVKNISTGTGGWIGYYPASLWTSSTPSGPAVTTFTDIDNGQVFGEISANSTPASTVCTDMGSNVLATTTAGASIGSTQFIGLPATAVNLNIIESPSGISPYWNAEALGTAGNIRTFRYGGPGGC
jgi:hypothetical protein